jgi:hypothetical protein
VRAGVILRAQRADAVGLRPLKLFVRARERRILVLKRRVIATFDQIASARFVHRLKTRAAQGRAPSQEGARAKTNVIVSATDPAPRPPSFGILARLHITTNTSILRRICRARTVGL